MEFSPAPAQSDSLRPHLIRRRQSLARQSSWLFATALFGYPVIGNLISLLQVESRLLSIPFRIIVALYSLWLVISTRRLHTDRLRQAMFLFWFLYTLRLINDWMFTTLQGADYALQFFVASSVLPAVALMKAGAYNRRRFAFVGFLIAGVGAITSLLAARYGNADIQEVTDVSGRLSLAALDPVSLGHLAASALLCGLVLWGSARPGAKVLLASVFLLLVWCLVLTGSKGPALALLVCVGLWALRKGQAWKFALLAIPMIVWMLVSSDNPLTSRLSGSEDDQSTVDRLMILSDSISQIEASPIMGSAFVELNSGFYPHNVFIEAGLALGIPGAILFLCLIAIGARRAWKSLRTQNDLLGLLFIQGVFAAATSGAIFGASLLWVTLAILPKSSAANAVPRRPAHQDLTAAGPPR